MVKFIILIFTILIIPTAYCEVAPELVKKHVAEIDQIIVGDLKNKRISLPAEVNDTIFVRRIYYW